MLRERMAVKGFTLIELLVVILIIVVVSVVALPVVVPAMSHREVREAARLVQGTLVGARDSAIHNNQPSGIRLLPDPAFLAESIATGLIDPSQILVANRIIPLDPAPEYSEGLCTPVTPRNVAFLNAQLVALGLPAVSNWPTNVPYPVSAGGATFYPTPSPTAPGQVLMLLENLVDPRSGDPGPTPPIPPLPNPPTSWYWNIRVGDRIQLNHAGGWYTVVGPLTVTEGANANGTFFPNPEMFVNAGLPGDTTKLPHFGGQPVEYLLLVNGQDDNSPPNGWIDEGWDGVDNNGNGATDENTATASEWETERWLGAIGSQTVVNVPYVIQRRPAPSPNARELALPSNVVIDLTGWGLSSPERSRIPTPMFNRFTGYVDIVLNPDGTVRPSTVYSSPASFGMGSAFVHLWLSERGDLAAPNLARPSAPFLPIPKGLGTTLFNGQEITGEYSLITLFTRTGQIASSENMPFLYNPRVGGFTNNLPVGSTLAQVYNANNPFIRAQQGVTGP